MSKGDKKRSFEFVGSKSGNARDILSLLKHLEETIDQKIIEEENKKISEWISMISDNQSKIAELTQALEEKTHESATSVGLAGLDNPPAPMSETADQ
jgi:hypothetical protein